MINITGSFAEICRLLISRTATWNIRSVVFIVNGKAVREILINVENLSTAEITRTCEVRKNVKH